MSAASSRDTQPPASSPSASQVAPTRNDWPEPYREIDRRYSAAVELVLYLASLTKPFGFFDPHDVGPIDVDRICDALAPAIRYTDADGVLVATLQRDRTCDQLRRRDGDSFVRFMHIGRVVAPTLSYPKNGHLTATARPDGYSLRLSADYVLSFSGFGPHALLVELKQLYLEGD